MIVKAIHQYLMFRQTDEKHSADYVGIVDKLLFFFATSPKLIMRRMETAPRD